jgi:hypothetical protein
MHFLQYCKLKEQRTAFGEKPFGNRWRYTQIVAFNMNGCDEENTIQNE